MLFDTLPVKLERKRVRKIEQDHSDDDVLIGLLESSGRYHRAG